MNDDSSHNMAAMNNSIRERLLEIFHYKFVCVCLGIRKVQEWDLLQDFNLFLNMVNTRIATYTFLNRPGANNMKNV
jgi:hypothetical protein